MTMMLLMLMSMSDENPELLLKLKFGQRDDASRATTKHP